MPRQRTAELFSAVGLAEWQRNREPLTLDDTDTRLGSARQPFPLSTADEDEQIEPTPAHMIAA